VRLPSLPPGAVLLALAASSPALESAFVDGSMPPAVAVERFLVTTLVAGVGWSVVRGIVRGYTETNERAAREADAEDVVPKALDAASSRPQLME
jgi:hypothetical protein